MVNEPFLPPLQTELQSPSQVHQTNTQRTLKMKIDYNVELRPFNSEFVSKHGWLAHGEAYSLETHINPEMRDKHRAIFGSEDQHEFVLTKEVRYSQFYSQVVAIPIKTEQLIGLGDGDFTIRPSKTDQYGRYIAYKCPKGKELISNRIEYVNINGMEETFIPMTDCHVESQDIIQSLPRTDDGVLYPMLALLAIKLNAMGGKYKTPELAAEELYDMEMVGGTEYMSKLSINGPIAPTFPRVSNFLPLKYSLKTFDHMYGAEGNLAFIAMRKDDDGGDFLPISFWHYDKRPFPLTFPAFHTAHTLLYNKDLICDGKPVYLTEYLELADKNINNENCVVVAFIGGEKGIPHNDFSPLASKKVVYLLLPADDEDDTKRAYRVALKAFAEIHKTGNRSFEVFDCETNTVIPTEQVKRDAIVRGLLEADEEDVQDTLRSYLSWPKQKAGATIVGRAFQSGRVGLVHGSAGAGKSLMAQAISTVAATGKSMDKGLFEFKGMHKCRVLVIQSEMPEDAIADRQRSLDGRMGNNTPTKVELHACEKSLTTPEEQAAVLRKLTTLDPKGESQWLVWIDTVKSTMPEVLNGNGNVFAEKVIPWVKIMTEAGISVTFIHHDNAQEECSGPRTLLALVDVVWHITPDKQARSSENCVLVTVEKPRYLTGSERARARWRWATDENKQITSFSSEFLDGEDTPAAETNATESNAETSHGTASEEPQANILNWLPRTIDELRALDVPKRRIACFELWNIHKTKKGIADYLNVSESLIEKVMVESEVDKNSKDEYFRQKLSNGMPGEVSAAIPSTEEVADGKPALR